VSYHHDWTLNTIDKLIGDSYNKGLLLYINSPGGGVYESDELYYKIQDYKQKTDRPVYVYMGSMAASGGYYISAPADKIYANRNAWTGSIGVIVGTLFDVSEFLEKHGIKATEITSGKNKAMGGYFEPMTPEQRAIYQSMVDEAYEQFVDIVAEGRAMSVEDVKKIADGRVLTAAQAKEAGLVDEIMRQEDFYTAVRDLIGNSSIEISDMNYHGKMSLFGQFLSILAPGSGGSDAGGSSAESATSDSVIKGDADGDIARILELAQQRGKAPIKYLYEG
jgi:protease-4